MAKILPSIIVILVFGCGGPDFTMAGSTDVVDAEPDSSEAHESGAGGVETSDASFDETGPIDAADGSALDSGSEPVVVACTSSTLATSRALIINDPNPCAYGDTCPPQVDTNVVCCSEYEACKADADCAEQFAIFDKAAPTAGFCAALGVTGVTIPTECGPIYTPFDAIAAGCLANASATVNSNLVAALTCIYQKATTPACVCLDTNASKQHFVKCF